MLYSDINFSIFPNDLVDECKLYEFVMHHQHYTYFAMYQLKGSLNVLSNDNACIKGNVL